MIGAVLQAAAIVSAFYLGYKLSARITFLGVKNAYRNIAEIQKNAEAHYEDAKAANMRAWNTLDKAKDVLAKAEAEAAELKAIEMERGTDSSLRSE